jgi:type IV pilus assembly protein PilW
MANLRTPITLNRYNQRGVSLVELMVGLTIGLFLLGAVGIIYVNTVNSSRASTQEAQMNEDATLALELLQQQIRLAGFSNVNAAGFRLFPGQAVTGCNGNSGTVNVGSSFANNASAFSALACNATSRADSFAVRYEATLLNSQWVNNAGVRVPGNCAHLALLPWNALALGEGAIVNGLALADNRYFIANDINGTRSLWCQGRTGAGFGAATALIPNIEDMQVQFAVTALPTVSSPIHHQVAGYVDANDAVLGATPANWARVAAIRICLLARSANTVPLGDNPVGRANPDGTTLEAGIGTFIDCDGVSRTITDRFIRRAYTTTVQLRNIRPALPDEYDGGANPWSYLYEN